jgi:hypothetical protein
MSKGSAPRPIPDWDKFEENWDRIFNKEEKNDESSRVDSKDSQEEVGHAS